MHLRELPFNVWLYNIGFCNLIRTFVYSHSSSDNETNTNSVSVLIMYECCSTNLTNDVKLVMFCCYSLYSIIWSLNDLFCAEILEFTLLLENEIFHCSNINCWQNIQKNASLWFMRKFYAIFCHCYFLCRKDFFFFS